MPSLILNGNRIAARRKSRRLVIRREDDRQEERASVEVHLGEVERATVIGHPSVTICALQGLMKEGIPVSFISERGHWYGTLHPDGDRNAARRIAQYRQHEEPVARLVCAKKLLQAKLRNQRRVLQRLAANRRRTGDPQVALAALQHALQTADSAPDRATLRGIEGLAAAHYFARLAAFFPEEIPFERRTRRPPKNAANALLSWTYTIVLSEIDTALRIHGLDPCIGWQHELANGRPALALDLLEPLRAPVCDLFVLNLLNHGILQNKHFHHRFDDGGTYLNEEARKIFFTHYETHMTRKFKLPSAPNHTNLRHCIEQQVFDTLHLLENPHATQNPFFSMP